FSWAEVSSVLHAVRPLPAAAGDVLGWAFDVVHWGGRARPAAAARRSISMEFIAASEPPLDDEIPLIPLNQLPSWNQPMPAIASALIAYRKFQPVVGRFEGVARGVLEGTRAGASSPAR